MGARLLKPAKAVGSVLAAVSVVFIAALLWRERAVLAAFSPDAGGLAVLGACALSYALLGWVLADAWRQLLVWAGETNVGSADTRRIFASTQIAKYIPGNIAQFAGRQLVGRQAGWTHAGLLLSTVFELGSLVLVGAVIATFAIVAGARGLIDPALLVLATVFVVAGFVLVPRVGPRLLARRWPETAQRLARLRMTGLWPISARHALFFAVTGLIMVFVTQVVIGEAVPWQHWPSLVGLFAIAWIASTLTPGAPSGLGVREVILVAGLAFLTSTGNAILISTLLRLVTVSGDVLFFAVAGTGPPKQTG